MAGELVEVAVIPGRLDAVEHGGGLLGAVPADAETVTVRLFGSELGVEALDDQRVLRSIEQLLEQDRRAGVCEPATHLGARFRTRVPGASPELDDTASNRGGINAGKIDRERGAP